MKDFRGVAVLRHSREAMWRQMRDRTPELAEHLADVAEITVLSRDECRADRVTIVSVWRSSATVPAVLRPVLQPEMLAWTDYAVWDQDRYECRWRIVPHVMSEACDCEGVTRFEEAMAGRGTRVTLLGRFTVSPSRLPPSTALIGAPAARGIEAFVSGLVPRNFGKLVKAAETALHDR
jgi:hypothetical protein